MMIDLFEPVDDSKELQEFAELAGWSATTPNEAFMRQLAETMKLENPSRPTKAGFIKPSSLTYCVRKLVYEFMGVEPESQYDGTPRIGESGTDAHRRIQNYISAMKEQGFDAEYIDIKEYLKQFPNPDVTVIDETEGHKIISSDVITDTIVYFDGTKQRTRKLSWYLDRYCGAETLLYNKVTHSRFKADGIVKYRGKYYVLEIKTETSKKYASHEKTLAPHDKHKLQGSFYALSFGIDEVMFLYENRDSCKFFVTIFTVDKDIRNTVVTLIQDTLRYGEAGMVAPRTIDKYECKYCPFKTRCDAVGESLPM